MNIVKLVFAFLFSIVQFFTPYVKMVTDGGIDSYFEKWSVNDTFKAEYAFTIEKKPGKDFKVLNFADIQLSSDEVYGEYGEIAEETIRKCIEEVKPDLITLTGDNAWCDMGYLRIVEIFESYGILWAPVMGNHDGNNGDRIKEAWDSYLLKNAEHCLFKYGPEGMGYGNYIINITENGKIIHTLFMMDTHSSADDTEAGAVNIATDENGNKYSGYDHLWANQIEWYKWAVKGVAGIAGHTVESSVFFHIPVLEYRYAMNKYCDIQYKEDGSFKCATPKEEYKDICKGTINEWICSPEGNNGFFTTCKELGSTKNMIAGHDHINDMSAEYEGIYLNYSLKCGPGCYWNEAKNGGSVLTIDSDGHGEFSHVHVNV